MAHYRKIDSRIWNDEKFTALSGQAQLAFLFLLTHPNTTMLGTLRGTVTGLATELNAKKRESNTGVLEGFGEALLEGYTKAFSEAIGKGLATYDDRACLVWLPNFLKYNAPESPNVIKAWPRAYDMIPECPTKHLILSKLEVYTEGYTDAFRKAFRQAFAKVLPKSMANQEQEQEQDIYPLLTNVSKGSDGALKTNGAVFIELPLKNGNTYPVPVHDVEIWTQDFLLINLRHELRMMKAWLEANPKKGKTKAGMPRFIVGWFQRASKEFPKRKLGPPEKKDLRAGRAANDDGSYKL